MTFDIPVRTVGPNAREHWRTRAKRIKRQRTAAYWLAKQAAPGPAWKYQVHLERFGPNTRPMDDDNLAGSMKGIRDGIADALDIDDGSKRLQFLYCQSRAKTYFVRVTITRI